MTVTREPGRAVFRWATAANVSAVPSAAIVSGVPKREEARPVCPASAARGRHPVPHVPRTPPSVKGFCPVPPVRRQITRARAGHGCRGARRPEGSGEVTSEGSAPTS